MAELPPELICAVVEMVVPSGDNPVAYSPSHPVTRTLLALTRTCKITYVPALKQLYGFCMYIDSSSRLELLLRTLSEHSTTYHGLNLSIYITSLYFAQYFVQNLPHEESLGRILPDVASTRQILNNIDTLLTMISPTLMKLVFDTPKSRHFTLLHSEYTIIDLALWNAFSKLDQLEEFTSVQDAFELSGINPSGGEYDAVWMFWPKLKHFALYKPQVGRTDFLEKYLGLSCLSRLVLVRPIVTRAPSSKAEFNVKTIDFEQFAERSTGTMATMNQRDITVESAAADSEDLTKDCHQWLRKAAIDRTLWK